MTDLQKAIQEFEDEAYHKRLHPEIRGCSHNEECVIM